MGRVATRAAGRPRRASLYTPYQILHICSRIGFGGMQTVCAKWGSELPYVPPCPGCEPVRFSHGWIQTLLMFGGEFTCIYIFLGMLVHRKLAERKRARAEPQVAAQAETRSTPEAETVVVPSAAPRSVPETPLASPPAANAISAVPAEAARAAEAKLPFRKFPHLFYFMLPSLADLASTLCYNIGVLYITAPIQQILRGLNVCFVALFSSCIWKDYRRKFDFPHIIGILLLVCGSTFVACSAIVFGVEMGNMANPVLGVALTLAGAALAALYYILEELFMKRHEANTLLCVSFEGIYGMLYMAIILPIFCHIPDPRRDPPAPFEDIFAWAYQLSVEPLLIAIQVLYVLASTMYNWSGMVITGTISAGARCTFSVWRTIVVWVVSALAGWEVWHPTATILTVLGFAFTVAGTLVYNGIWRAVPYLRAANVDVYGRGCNCGCGARGGAGGCTGGRRSTRSASAEPPETPGAATDGFSVVECSKLGSPLSGSARAPRKSNSDRSTVEMREGPSILGDASSVFLNEPSTSWATEYRMSIDGLSRGGTPADRHSSCEGPAVLMRARSPESDASTNTEAPREAAPGEEAAQ